MLPVLSGLLLHDDVQILSEFRIYSEFLWKFLQQKFS